LYYGAIPEEEEGQDDTDDEKQAKRNTTAKCKLLSGRPRTKPTDEDEDDYEDDNPPAEAVEFKTPSPSPKKSKKKMKQGENVENGMVGPWFEPLVYQYLVVWRCARISLQFAQRFENTVVL